jgi:DNA ligase-1
MKFAKLSEYFEKLEKTASRLTMTEILADVLKEANKDEMEAIVNLSLGQLRPKFNKLEFSLAEKMVLRAIAEATGESLEKVTKTYKECGDIGETVEMLMANDESQMVNEDITHPSPPFGKGRGPQMSVVAVYGRLCEIAKEGGEGSQERKVNGLAKLLAELEPRSAKFVARMVVGKLRLGFSDMTVLDSLSWMETGGKSRRKQLELAYQLAPDIGELARLVKVSSSNDIEEKVKVKLGVPVVPALAQRLKTAKAMIEKMGKVAVEPKFDGTRVQIHFRSQKSGVRSQNGEEWNVKTFTRNLDETTAMFPELNNLGEYVDAKELVLDSEAVGFDPVTGKMRSFQETIQRKRKHGVAEAAVKIPLKFHIFDVLYKDGESLVHLPFHDRRSVLEKTVKDGPFTEVPEMLVTEDAEELKSFHKHQLAEGLEGAVVKKWNGVYEPGRKGWSWVKFKEAEGTAAKLSDTVDAVVMGLYFGKGKRTGFGVGAFLVGIRAEEGTRLHQDSGEAMEGRVYTVSKVGTGLSDEQWRELAARSKELEASAKPKEYVVDKNLEPDIWLDPKLIVEIAADEVTKSPIHTAGFALRFPRLIKFRDDKSVDEVTSIDEVMAMRL